MAAPWMVCVELDRSDRGWQPHGRLGEVLESPSSGLLASAAHLGLQTAVLTSGRSSLAGCEHWVDRVVRCDTRNPGTVAAVARALGGPVAAIVGPVASSVPVAAAAACVLGLPGPTPGGPPLGAPPIGVVPVSAGWGSGSRGRVRLGTAAAGGGPVAVTDRNCAAGGRGWWGAPQDRRRSAAVCRLDAAVPGGVSPAVIHRADGFLDATGFRFFSWTEIRTTVTGSVRAKVESTTTAPAFGEFEELVASSIRRAGYDFGPFSAAVLVGHGGPDAVRWQPVLTGAGVGQIVQAVAGHDPAAYHLARLLGHEPAPERATVGAATRLELALDSVPCRLPMSQQRAIGEVPGFLAAEVLANTCGGRLGRVVTLGGSIDEAERRARAAGELLRVTSADPEPV